MSQSQCQAVDQRQDSDVIFPLDSDNLSVSSRQYAYTNVLIRSIIDLFSSDGVMNRTASLMTELGASQSGQSFWVVAWVNTCPKFYLFMWFS